MNEILQMAHGVSLAPGTLAVLILLALWLAVGEPVSGYLTHRRFLAVVAIDPGSARRRLYRQWTTMLAVLGLVVLTAFSVLPGLNAGMLGLRPMRNLGHIDPAILVILGGVGAGMMLSLVVARFAGKRSGNAMAHVGGGARLSPMLPRTREERLTYVVLSVVASVVEEMAWRGFAVFLFSYAWPSADIVTTACVTGVLFGIVHLYQGWSGVLATTLMGGVLCLLYLYSGSILLPVVLHMAVNLRAVFMAPWEASELNARG